LRRATHALTKKALMVGQNAKPQKKNRSAKDAGGFSRIFGDVANKTSQAAGRASAFMLAAGVVLVWAITGPLFGFSDTWQLVINTGTTIVTFLMVFLIQNSQNRDSAAIQVKLDELIRVGAARNSLVGIEHLTDDELEDLRSKCEARAKAEKFGEETVKETGEKARKAARAAS
jgi:low affinity Fe/Cu permease